MTKPTHLTHTLRTLAWLLATAVFAMAPCARAAPAVGVAGVHLGNGVIPEAHGWLLLPDPATRRTSEGGPPGLPGSILIHLPPRQASIHGGAPGIGRRSRTLAAPPLGIAAQGRRVYLLGETASADAGPDGTTSDGAGPDQRRYIVRSAEAWATAVAGMWQDRPVGRLESLPPLITDATAVGFAATQAGPAALLEAGGVYSVAEFADGAWRIDPLPADAAARLGPTPVFLSTPRSLVVVGELTLISDRAHESAESPADRTGEQQKQKRNAWRSLAIDLPNGSIPVGLIGQSVVAWSLPEDGSETATIAICRENGVQTIGLPGFGAVETGADRQDDTAGTTPHLGLVVIPDASGRLVVIAGTPIPGDRRVAYRTVEVSLSTGAVLYAGPVEPVTPVSATEFKILAAALVIMMVVSLVVVLRPTPGDHAIVVPDGCALASPGRRLAATVFDAAVCAMIVSRVSGIPFADIVTTQVLLSPDKSWLALPAVIAVGLVYGTLSETILSATLGKLMMGCRVVRVPSEAGPPSAAGFARSLVRNTVKWCLPPAASLALLEPTGRHRGDLLAGAVVVVRLEPDADDLPS